MSKEKKTYNFSILCDREKINEYRELCEKNGFSMTNRIRKFFNDEISLLKKIK
jgi:hypothetical protein